VIREFNMLTPEWELKFGIIHPGREDWNFGGVDAIVDFAEEYDMQVRGHTLIWFLDMPTWFQNYVGTRDEYIELMREHIYTVVNRYEGRIPVWDVVNEAFDDGGAYRNTIWLRLIGPEYIELAFEFAHEADPDALLFYNDYNIEYRGAKFARVRKMVEDFQARDVPIHGVGMQMHLGMGHYQPPPEDIALNMAELESLGIQVHITEMDIAITQGQGDIEERLQWQADYYADVAAVCIEAPNCTALVTWGFTDRYTWLHFFRHPTEQPLLFDAEYEPKPSYYRLFDAFAAR
jgi:endo-1,4-beta-xylanase